MNTNDDYLSSRPPLRKKSIKKTPKNNNYRHSLWVLAAACTRHAPDLPTCNAAREEAKKREVVRRKVEAQSTALGDGRGGEERRGDSPRVIRIVAVESL